MGTDIPTEDAARFVRALGGNGAFLFQTYPERPGPRRGLAYSRLGSFARLAPELAKRNAKGAAVAVLVNVNDGTRHRKRENIRAVRALFVDLDGSPLAPVEAAPLPPHIITQTSPGRFHAFWRVRDCPLPDFVRLQKALAERFDGDALMADVARVVRVPGFEHHKGERVLSRLLEVREGEPYTYADFLRAFGIEPPPVVNVPMRTGPIPTGERNASLFRMAASAHRKGIPEREELESVLAVNANCEPPLDEREVCRIVASAYSQPISGHASVPFACWDSPAWRSLNSVAKEVLCLAYRRYDGHNNGRIALPWSQCRDAFSLERRAFYNARRRLVESGLLTIETPPRAPRPDRKPTAALYRLRFVIGAAREPYRAAA